MQIMEKLPDTIIPYDFIRGNQRVWQAHLERISDFLLPGERIWWSQDEQGVTFHDGPHQPNSHEEGPETHHFRSSTLKSEEKYLKQCWETIMEQKIPVPTSRIIHDREDGLFEWETTNLKQFHSKITLRARIVSWIIAPLEQMKEVWCKMILPLKWIRMKVK